MNNFNPLTERVEKLPSSNNGLNEIQSSSKVNNDPNALSDICVSQWIDYSSKYGLGKVLILLFLGYILNNGCSGVFFNDSTKMIMEPSGKYFQYKERRPTDKLDISTTY